jgi:hypothetical protein
MDRTRQWSVIRHLQVGAFLSGTANQFVGRDAGTLQTIKILLAVVTAPSSVREVSRDIGQAVQIQSGSVKTFSITSFAENGARLPWPFFLKEEINI